MALRRIRTSRSPRRGDLYGQLGLSAPPKNNLKPRAISDGDFRMTRAGMARAVFSFMRGNEILERATPPYPTALAEYRIPHPVLMQPGPLVWIYWNRVMLYPYQPAEDPGVNVQPGDFYLYRTVATADVPSEQRVRLGRNPDPQDIVTATYIIDYGVET